jgi:hypothetical protein
MASRNAQGIHWRRRLLLAKHKQAPPFEPSSPTTEPQRTFPQTTTESSNKCDLTDISTTMQAEQAAEKPDFKESMQLTSES